MTKTTLTLVNIWKIENHTPHFGLTALAAYIKNKFPKLNIKIVEGLDPLNDIIKTKADIIGFTSDTLTFKKTKTIATKVKNILKVPILIGGVHITAMPKSFSSPFNVGIIGEGEITLLELIELFLKDKKFNPEKLKNINGLIFKINKSIIKTLPRKLMKNIDELPFPARELTPMEDVYLKNQFNLFNSKRMVSIMTSRGCPYHCVFCGSPVQWGMARFHSPEYVIREIKFLLKTYRIDGIMFWDDLFIAPIERLKKLKDLIVKEKLNKKLVFFGYARANLITEDVCKILAEMNTKRLIFGLESGSPKILGYLKQYSVTVEDNKRAVDLCRKHGITSSSGYIVGTPGETIEDLQCTYNLMKNHPLDNTQIYILTPYPGTKIWEESKKEKIVSDNMDFDKLFVQLPTLSLLDFFTSSKNIIKNRIFLNTQYKNNKNYMKLILKIQKLALIQNTLFYTKIIPQNIDLLKRLIIHKFKCL